MKMRNGRKIPHIVTEKDLKNARGKRVIKAQSLHSNKKREVDIKFVLFSELKKRLLTEYPELYI
jgi:hypothetical protein